MWTLTIDPELFATPAAAWEYLRENRCISRWVRELKRKGHLKSGAYFCVVEFHESGWPHFHILLETDFVPFSAACAAWDRFRPESAPAPEGTGKGFRPAFGGCRFSKGKGEFENMRHAANYATKYVIKTPEYGWPEWVTESTGNVVRYSASRGLLPSQAKADKLAEEETTIEDDNLAAAAAFFEEAGREISGEVEPEDEAKRRTVQERLDGCAVKAVVCAVSEIVMPGGQVFTERKFLGEASQTFAELADEFLREEGQQPWRFFISGDELRRLLQEEGFVTECDSFYRRLRRVQGYLFDRDEHVTRTEELYRNGHL